MVDPLCDCMAASVGNTSSHEAGCYTEMSAARQHCALCFRDQRPHDGWCEHLTDYIKQGLDERELSFGIEIDVPLVIKYDIWAKVRISNESIANVCAPIVLLVDDLFTSDVEEFDLGLWNVGEGMWSIRSVCLDWMKGRTGIAQFTDPAICMSSAHNPFKHDRLLALMNAEQVMWHNWIIACHGLCLPEYGDVKGVQASLVPNTSQNSSNNSDILNQIRGRSNP